MTLREIFLNGCILVAPIKKDGKQFIVKFTKDARGEITQKALDECLFVPLLGGIEEREPSNLTPLFLQTPLLNLTTQTRLSRKFSHTLNLKLYNRHTNS